MAGTAHTFLWVNHLEREMEKDSDKWERKVREFLMQWLQWTEKTIWASMCTIMYHWTGNDGCWKKVLRWINEWCVVNINVLLIS